MTTQSKSGRLGVALVAASQLWACASVTEYAPRDPDRLYWTVREEQVLVGRGATVAPARDAIVASWMACEPKAAAFHSLYSSQALTSPWPSRWLPNGPPILGLPDALAFANASAACRPSALRSTPAAATSSAAITEAIWEDARHVHAADLVVRGGVVGTAERAEDLLTGIAVGGGASLALGLTTLFVAFDHRSAGILQAVEAANAYNDLRAATPACWDPTWVPAG